MAKVRILQYPDPRLKTVGETVTEVNDEIRQIVADMFETHYSTDNCAALAATQLDFENPKRITVIDYSPNRDQPLCLINPEIIEREGEQYDIEGCKSVPGNCWERVKRAKRVKVRALNEKGEEIIIEGEDYFAKCLQHEIDHLHGRIFLDHLSSLKRRRCENRIAKWYRLMQKQKRKQG